MIAEPLRLGYVGCGFMAQHVHLPHFATLEGLCWPIRPSAEEQRWQGVISWTGTMRETA